VSLPKALFAPPFAHRGLWSADGAAENSLTAFEKACRSGYGIELDVRLSADGEAMVFHDEALERMTGAPGRIEELPAAELSGLSLLGGPDRIPSLGDALQLVAGRAMLLVEIKAGQSGSDALTARTGELLERYTGPAAAISFDAQALALLAARRPQLLRGLDALGLERPEGGKAFERACARAEPHFLALQLESVATERAARHRADGLPVIAWTVRTPADAALVHGQSDNLIFEGFAP
jgi:glycerophosphoryl diester phosphodiesterase